VSYNEPTAENLDCQRAQALVDAQLDTDDFSVSALSEAEQQFLDEHLLNCATCRREARVLGQAIEALKALEPIASPADLTDRIMARLEWEQSATGSTGKVVRPARWQMGAIAAAVLAIVISLSIIGPWRSVEDSPFQTPVVASRPAVPQPTTLPPVSPSGTASPAGTGSAVKPGGQTEHIAQAQPTSVKGGSKPSGTFTRKNKGAPRRAPVYKIAETSPETVSVNGELIADANGDPVSDPLWQSPGASQSTGTEGSDPMSQLISADEEAAASANGQLSLVDFVGF
jgi:hypothetical protein